MKKRITSHRVTRRCIYSDESEISKSLEKGLVGVRVVGLSPTKDISLDFKDFKKSFFEDDIRFIPEENQQEFNEKGTTEFHILEIKTVTLKTEE